LATTGDRISAFLRTLRELLAVAQSPLSLIGNHYRRKRDLIEKKGK
jgi:hypothetical protein